MAFPCQKWRHHEYIDTVTTVATLDKIKMASDSASLAKVRASIPISRPMRLHIFFCRMKLLCSFINESYIDLFLRHNFDHFFIHDCFELHDGIFEEYPGSRGMVTSRNILERVPFQWLKAIHGIRRT